MPGCKVHENKIFKRFYGKKILKNIVRSGNILKIKWGFQLKYQNTPSQSKMTETMIAYLLLDDDDI